MSNRLFLMKERITGIFRAPVLSDHRIMQYNKRGMLFESPIKPEQLQPNSVDLTLGDSCKILRPNVLESPNFDGSPIIDPRIPIRYEQETFAHSMSGDHYYVIKPKEFILMASNEVLNIPNGIIAFVQGRSSVARLAIQTEQAGLIDAGFRGTITFEVFNQSEYPIILYKGTRIAQVYFFRAQCADVPYGYGKGSKYHGQILATGSKLNLDKENS